MPILGQILGFVFSGEAFSLDLAEYQAGKIFVYFSANPKSVNPTDPDSGLNPSSYVLTGDSPNAIASVETTADPKVLALTPLYPMSVGYWKIQALGTLVGEDGLTYMGLPDSYTFLVGSMFLAPPISQGASNQNSLEILTQFLNPAYATKPNWQNVLDSVSVGEQKIYDNARLAYDQLYLSTASGKYLTQRAGDVGLSRPTGVGLSDELFRQFAIRNSNRQLTEESILSVLEIFYGVDSVRAHAVSELPEPYNIADGDELEMLIDERFPVKVVFKGSDFGIPGAGTAIEVAASITRWMALNSVPGVALSYQDPQNDEIYVKIYSCGLGQGSAVRITGGMAQEALRFPSYLTTPYEAGSADATWDIVFDSVTENVTFTATNATSPDLSKILIGDYVNVVGSEFDPANQGSFKILDVQFEYTFGPSPDLIMSFTVNNPDGVNESVIQVQNSSLSFYRPNKQTTFSGSNNSVVVVDLPEGLEVHLPATSPAVSREPYIAAYLHDVLSYPVYQIEAYDGVLRVTSLEAMTGLSTGDLITISGVEMSPTNLPPQVDPSPGDTGSSYLDYWATVDPFVFSSYGGYLLKLDEDTSLLGGGGGVDLAFAPGINNLTVGVNVETVLVDLTVSKLAGNAGRQGAYSVTSSGTDTARLHPGATSLTPYWRGNADVAAIITGGWEPTANPTIFQTVNDTSAYRISTSTVIPMAGNMIAARAGHLQFSTDNGVYVMGGMTDWQRTTTACELLEPADYSTGAWVSIAAMSKPRFLASGVVLDDESFLVTGGRTLANGPYLEGPSVALYRLDDSTTTPAGTGTGAVALTASNVTFSTATYAANSKNGLRFTLNTSQATGTLGAGNDILDAIDAGDFTAEMWWRREGSFASSPERSFFAVANATTTFSMGPSYSSPLRWCVFWDNSGRQLTQFTTQITDSLDRTWNHIAVTVKRTGTTATVRLYLNGIFREEVAGILRPLIEATSVIRFGKDIEAAYSNNGDVSLGQFRFSGATLTDSEIWQSYMEGTGDVVWNAFNDNYTFERMGVFHNTCEIYDVGTNTWLPTGSMTFARSQHATLLLPNGEVAAIAGFGYEASNGGRFKARTLRECEIWSPLTGRWRPMGNLPVGAGGPMWATWSETKQAIIAGGSIDGFVYKWPLETRTWERVVDTLLPNRTYQNAVLMQDAVMVTGGQKVYGGLVSENHGYYIMGQQNYYAGYTFQDQLLEIASTPSSNVFTVNVPYQGYLSSLPGVGGGEITAMAAVEDVDLEIPGPFLMSPYEGVFPTKFRDTVSTPINAHQALTQIDLTDISAWPEEGYFVINLGQADQMGPVKYYTKLNNQSILVDGSFGFEYDVPQGAFVDLLIGKGPYNPATSQSLGVFYLTDSPAGRAAAEAATKDSVAAGVNPIIRIIYPGDRGLGGEGSPTEGSGKLSDIVEVFSHETDTGSA